MALVVTTLAVGPVAAIPGTSDDSYSGMSCLAGCGESSDPYYTVTDSDDPNGPTYEWVEISETGEVLMNLSGSGYYYETVELPFPLYESESTALTVYSTGEFYVSGTWSFYPFYNHYYHYGYDYEDITGTVYYQAEDDRVIIQWQTVSVYNSGYTIQGSVTYQAIIYDDGTVVFQYKDVDASTYHYVGAHSWYSGVSESHVLASWGVSYTYDGLAVEFSPTPAPSERKSGLWTHEAINARSISLTNVGNTSALSSTLGSVTDENATESADEGSDDSLATTVGEEVSLSFTVENKGTRHGSFAAIVTADGEKIGRERVRIDPGERYEFEFTHAFEEAGSYQIWVRNKYVATVVVSAN